MPTDQTAQAFNTLVAQPVDKLATIIGILGMVLVVLLVLFGWRLFKYISNTDSPLVKVFREVRDAFNGLKASQAEKSNEVIVATRETNTILKDQTVVLRDFTNFQKTNNEHVADLGDKVESLEVNTDKRLKALEEKVESLNNTIQDLPNCEEFTKQLEEWKVEIITAVKEQAKHDTSTNVTVNTAPAGNLLADSASAADGKAA